MSDAGASHGTEIGLPPVLRVTPVANRPAVSGTPVLGGVAATAALALLVIGPGLLGGDAALVWVLPLAVAALFCLVGGTLRESLLAAVVAVAYLVLAFTPAVATDTAAAWYGFGAVSLAGTGWCLYALHRTLRARARETDDAQALRFRESDPLTRLLRRPMVELFLDRYVAAAKRGEALSVVLVHLDDFASFVRHHGPEAGQELLAKVGEVLRASARDSDVTGRYQNAEFLTLLAGEDARGAAIYADRIRKRLSSLAVHAPDGSLITSGVTASAGIATFEPRMASASALVERADDALRVARTEGGNQVRLAVAREGVRRPEDADRRGRPTPPEGS